MTPYEDGLIGDPYGPERPQRRQMDSRIDANPLITEARRLRAAATQGKWQAWRQGNQYLQPETSNETVVGASVLKPLIRPWSPYAVRVEDPSEVRLTDEDADFITFAANHILAFADKIEEQEKEIEILRLRCDEGVNP